MKKLILSLIVVVAAAGSIKAETYEEYGQRLKDHKSWVKTWMPVSDAAFILGVAFNVLHGTVQHCTVAGLCTAAAVAPVAAPTLYVSAIAAYLAGATSVGMRMSQGIGKCFEKLHERNFFQLPKTA